MKKLEREELLKERIIQLYGSVLKLSKASGIPESSIRNIFSRGLDSVNAGTLVEICKYAKIDVESLMNGDFQPRPSQKDWLWEAHVLSNEQKKEPADHEANGLSEKRQKLINLVESASDKELDLVFRIVREIVSPE